MAPKLKRSAGARIKAQGKSLVWVTLSPGEKEKIRVASAYEGVPMSQFVKQYALTAAEKILKNPPEMTD